VAEDTITKLRITVGTFGLEFEGSEAFLRSEVPKFVRVASELQASNARVHLGILQNELEESRSTQAEIDKLIETIRSDLDSLSEMGETESLRLQMAMDRLSKLMSTLSNLLKKASETASGIAQNLK
jgi:hypothetical protein